MGNLFGTFGSATGAVGAALYTSPRAPSIKTLTEFFGSSRNTKDPLTAAQIKELHTAMKDANSHKGVDAALDLANRLLHAHGIEAIRGKWIDNYYQDSVLLYVNMGDTYTGTIIYETNKHAFSAGTYGDWVERHSEEYEVQ